MEEVFFHPKVVHLPLGLALVSPLLAGGILFAWWRDWYDRSVWWIAVVAQVLLAVSVFFAMETGEWQEERVEKIVGEARLDAHEEAAEALLWGAGIVACLAAVVPWLPDRRRALAVALVVALGAAVNVGLALRVGARGGELVYRHGAAAAYVEGTPAAEVPPVAPSPRVAPRDDD